MNYFIDTEFLEGTQKRMFGETKPTIDLISIGIVCEDGREYYAISKDFNLKEAWNRYDWKQKKVSDGIPGAYKDYWIRDNVLKPIYDELIKLEIDNYQGFVDPLYEIEIDFTYSNFKRLIKKYGKTNKQIAEEIKMFISLKDITGGFGTRLPLDNSNREYEDRMNNLLVENFYYKPEFYGYYADYDWVAFCWLFGKMIDLPKWFPYYCIDLKQTLDGKANNVNPLVFNSIKNEPTFLNKIDWIKNNPNYPKQTNEHSAIHDARWNFELYKFLTDTQWI